MISEGDRPMTVNPLNINPPYPPGVHGPMLGNPRLRSLPPEGFRRGSPPSKSGRPQVTMLGCLSSFDYLCHDRSCNTWKVCQYGGNRD